jgi:hypothetical protein
MHRRAAGLSGLALATAIAVGGVAVALPTPPSSAATGVPRATGHRAPTFTLTQLLDGLFFHVGPAGKLIDGTATASTPTKLEATLVKGYIKSYSASQQAAIAKQLQSGIETNVVSALNAIDNNAGQIGLISGLTTASGTAAAPQLSATAKRALAAASRRLHREGDLGVFCGAQAGPNATSCAARPSAVSYSTSGCLVAFCAMVTNPGVIIWDLNTYYVIVFAAGASAAKSSFYASEITKVDQRVTKALAK